MGEPIVLYYVGRRTIAGSLKHCFVKTVDADMLTHFKIKPSTFQGAVIGTQYTIADTFPQRWQDARTGHAGEEKATAWQAIDRAEYLAHSEKAVDSSPHLTRALEVINSARKEITPSKRTAFDIWVLQELRK